MKTPWASIAKIEVEGVHSGTGFLVTKNYVLTALHVVADKTTGRPFSDIILRFYPNAEHDNAGDVVETKAQIVQDLWNIQQDFALLECDRVPPSAEPLVLSDRCQPFQECSSPGFALQKDTGFTVTGKISSLNDPVEAGVTAIGIQFDFGSGVLMKGHSGAPVIARGRAVGLLRTAFQDEADKTMGGIVHATSIQQVVAFCNRDHPGVLGYSSYVQWPAPLRTHSRILADRKEEFEVFEAMITGQRRERVLLLEGKSGSGKTVLANELAAYARGIGVQTAQADCKGCPPIDSIFRSILFDLRPEILRTAASAVGDSRFVKMVDDLSDLARPALIALDTWQESSDEVRRWVEQVFLRDLARMPGALLLISGREVPSPPATWADLAVVCKLAPITSPEEWFEYAQRKSPKIARDEVTTITKAARGMPNVIDGLLDGLREDKATALGSGG